MLWTTVARADDFRVDQRPANPWKVGDMVCVERGGENLCGKVTTVDGNQVIVQRAARSKGVTIVPKRPTAAQPAPKPAKPDPIEFPRLPEPEEVRVPPAAKPATRPATVRPAQEPAPRSISPTREPPQQAAPTERPPARRLRKIAAAEPPPTAATNAAPEGSRRWLVGPVLALGPSFFFPGATAQFAPSRRWSAGALFFYAKGTSDTSELKAIGGFLTASYYFEPSAPLGFFIQTGAGLFSLEGQSPTRVDRITPPVALGLVGWRGSLPSGLGAALSAGGQYVLGPASGAIRYHGLLPLAVVELSLGL